MRRSFLAFLILLALASAAVWLTIGRSGGNHTEPPASAAKPQAEAPPSPVRVTAAWTERVDDEITAVGTLAADEMVVIRPELPGRIQEIRFTEGAAVKAGDILFLFNTDESRATLAQAEAQQLLDQQNFNRVQEMRAKNLTSAQQYDEVLAKLKYSSATAERERVRLGKLTIRAPFAGLVGLRQVSVGDYVKEGEALVNLEALNPVKLDFKAPEKYAASIRSGLGLTASVEAFPNQEFAGTVYAIDPRLDEATRTLRIRARIANDRLLLRPGMFTRVRLGLSGKRNAVLVPEEALVLKGSGALVFRVRDGKAWVTTVTTGMRRKGTIEIVTGLQAGDVVVTDGHTKLRDESRVSVVDAAR